MDRCWAALRLTTGGAQGHHDLGQYSVRSGVSSRREQRWGSSRRGQDERGWRPGAHLSRSAGRWVREERAQAREATEVGGETSAGCVTKEMSESVPEEQFQFNRGRGDRDTASPLIWRPLPVSTQCMPRASSRRSKPAFLSPPPFGLERRCDGWLSAVIMVKYIQQNLPS